MGNELTHVGGEVLSHPFDKRETDRVERRAVSLYGTAQQTTVQFAAELRRLQDGGAHLSRGYANFGEYAEHTFEGLTKVNAQMISRQGAVLLILEANGRIKLEGKGENLPGTTGVRVLAKLLKEYGQDTMLQIYDRAAENGKVLEANVVAAQRELLTPPVHELGEGAKPEVEPDEGEDDWSEGHSDKVQELIDNIRDLSWNLPESADELSEAIERLKAEVANESTSEDQQWLNSKR